MLTLLECSTYLCSCGLVVCSSFEVEFSVKEHIRVPEFWLEWEFFLLYSDRYSDQKIGRMHIGRRREIPAEIFWIASCRETDLPLNWGSSIHLKNEQKMINNWGKQSLEKSEKSICRVQLEILLGFLKRHYQFQFTEHYQWRKLITLIVSVSNVRISSDECRWHSYDAKWVRKVLS